MINHHVLTAAVMAGEIDLARARTLQELRRAQPNISLAWIDSHMLIAHEADLVDFRRAGLE